MLKVWSHSANLVKEDIFQPVAVFKVEFLCLMCKVDLEVLLCENGLWQALEVLSALKDLIFT